MSGQKNEEERDFVWGRERERDFVGERGSERERWHAKRKLTRLCLNLFYLLSNRKIWVSTTLLCETNHVEDKLPNRRKDRDKDSSKIWYRQLRFLVRDGDRIAQGGKGEISQAALFEHTVRTVVDMHPLPLPTVKKYT